MTDVSNHKNSLRRNTNPVFEKGGKQDVKRILVIMMIVALCLSLCACGSYRANESTKDYETQTTERPGGTTDTTKNRSTGTNRTDKGTGNGTTDRQTDMTPDPEDGYIEDGSAGDGMIDGEHVTPSPNATHRP